MTEREENERRRKWCSYEYTTVIPRKVMARGRRRQLMYQSLITNLPCNYRTTFSLSPSLSLSLSPLFSPQSGGG